MLGWLALIVAALTGLFIFAQSYSGEMSASTAGVSAAGVVALLIAMYIATHRKARGETRLPQIIGASLLALAVAAGAWWFGKAKLSGGLDGKPKPALEDRAIGRAGTVSVLIRRSADGKFLAQGRLNDTDASLLFDTGASAVMIKHSDAEKAGIDVQSLAYTTPVQTANGTIYAAPIRLRSIAVGLLRLEDIEALVAKPGSLNENLLGMSFLRRLGSYDLKGDFLTLRE